MALALQAHYRELPNPEGGTGALRKRAWAGKEEWNASPPSSAAATASPAAATPFDSLLRGLRPALAAAQVFCLLPVGSPTDPLMVDFRWKSTRTALTVVMITLSVWKSSFSFIRMLERGIKYNTSVNAIFFTMTIMAQLLFLRMSLEWPSVVRGVAKVEAVFHRAYGLPRRLRLRMLAVTAAGLAMAAVEHAMYIAVTIGYLWPCYDRGGLNLLIQGYCITKYQRTFTSIRFNWFSATLVITLQIVNQFVWSYLDLFVALITMGLSAHFRQINVEIKAAQDEWLQRKPARKEQFWKATRKHYNGLADLVRQVNRVIGPVVLVTYASDLYFICLQTLAIVNPVNVSKLHRVYFLFSLAYIILRTTFMTYVASNLNEESKRPKDVLFEMPSRSFSMETDRFLKQVLADDVALTGCHFFTITRSFLLTVAGTIVTYVVVLVQFNKHPEAAGGHNNGTVVCSCQDLKVFAC